MLRSVLSSMKTAYESAKTELQSLQIRESELSQQLKARETEVEVLEQTLLQIDAEEIEYKAQFEVGQKISRKLWNYMWADDDTSPEYLEQSPIRSHVHHEWVMWGMRELAQSRVRTEAQFFHLPPSLPDHSLLTD